MKLSWVFCVVLPLLADGYRILCLLPYSGKSHYMVFEPLLYELSARGHNLTVVSFFPPAKPIPNRRDVSLVGLAPINVEVIDFKMLEVNMFGLERYFEFLIPVMGLARSCLDFCKKLLDAEVFQEFVRAEGEYDLILTEHFNSDCMLGIVHKYGAPAVGLSSCALLPWQYGRVGAPDNPAYVPGMTLPVTADMSFAERVENAFFFYTTLLWFELAIRREEQRLLEARLGQLPPLGDVARGTSLLLVNTHHALNGNRVLPPSVVEVGGIHLHNRTVKPLPPDLALWAATATEGFIILSFGSLVRGASLPETTRRVLAGALGRLPHRVLWKWEDEASAHLFPENVRPVRWLPQYDLLQHPNCVAFITHGGLLSLTEAVAAGRPVLAVPLLGDQFGNAAHAKRLGMAEVLRVRDIDEDSLTKALKKILSPETRARARRVRAVWRDRAQAPMDAAVFHVERVARHGLRDLSGEARWLSPAQLLLLDVAAFFAAVLGLPLYLALKLISTLCRPNAKLKQS